MDAIYHLGDDPDHRCVWTGAGRMPRFRRSMGVLWHPATRTLVTGRERLAAMGWPIYDSLAARAGTSVPIHVASMPTRQQSQAAGNSYHVALAGVFQFVSLACTRFVSSE
jgi:hypothetical protein